MQEQIQNLQTKQIDEIMKGASKPAQLEKSASLVTWRIEKDEKGKNNLSVEANFTTVDSTTLTAVGAVVRTPATFRLMGMTISLEDKKDFYIESYQKFFAQSKSHNFLLARFADLKVMLFGQLLSSLGYTPDDLRKLQAEAVGATVAENQSLFAENTYNSELLEIVGGSKRKVKAQRKAFAQIENQLLTQANNLGIRDRYSREGILEIRREQCRKIVDEFKDEQAKLKYQLEYMKLA